MTINPRTNATPISEALMPLSIESRPRRAPTVRSSSMYIGAGNAPARNTIARSPASSTVNLPVMLARPDGIFSFMRGAEWIFPSRTIASLFPIF